MHCPIGVTTDQNDLQLQTRHADILGLFAYTDYYCSSV